MNFAEHCVLSSSFINTDSKVQSRLTLVNLYTWLSIVAVNSIDGSRSNFFIPSDIRDMRAITFHHPLSS